MSIDQHFNGKIKENDGYEGKHFKVKERKQAKPSIIEKFKNLKKWQKALAVVAVVAGVTIVGVAAYNLLPVAVGTISHILNPDTAHVSTQSIASGLGNDSSIENTIKEVAQLDYSQIGDGSTVYYTASDAANNANSLSANGYFGSTPIDVFDTVYQKFLHLTSEQLHNAQYMSELAKQKGMELLMGNERGEASGWVHIKDAMANIKSSEVLETLKGMTR